METKTKKKYEKPTMIVIEVEPTGILAGSGTPAPALDVSDENYISTGDEGYWGD